MRIVVFGTGGAGGYFGAQLTRAEDDVIFIARGDHLSAIRTHGLCIETPAGEIVFRPALATDDPTGIGKADVVLLGVKAWQVTEAAETIRPMMGSDTFVVPLQNGVEAPSQLAAALGAEHLNPCWPVNVAARRQHERPSIGVRGRATISKRELRRVLGLLYLTKRVAPRSPAQILRRLGCPAARPTLFGRIGTRANMPFPVHPHMLRHAASMRWPMPATTRGRYSTISGTRISSTPFAIPSFRQRASGTSGRTDGMLLCPREPTCSVLRISAHVRRVRTKPMSPP